ncbi:MAG: choline dehydrogenase, partial [Proteobacteria bacterium]|nr:choline dehydrogenase [Pseudomonadota bacterium]
HTMVNPKVNWMYQTEPEAELHGRRMAMPRGRILGGTSSINGMLYVRGQKQDFDDWQAAGNPGWSYDAVRPYFIKSENSQELLQAAAENGQKIDAQYHGQLGPLSVSALRLGPNILDDVCKAARQQGYPRNDDYNGQSQAGFGYFQVTQKNGQRHSAYRAFLHPVRHRKNLHIITSAHVTNIEFDGKKAVGVRYSKGGRGAFGSPQLLELSGIGRPDILKPAGIEIRHALDGVGEHLSDHFLTRLTWRLAPNSSLNETSRGIALLKEIARYALFRKGSLSLTAGLLAGFVSSDPNETRPDIQYHIAHASFANPARRIFDRFPGLTIGPCPLRPHSRGYVHICSSDPFAPPSIRFNYLSADKDKEVLVRGMEIARDIMRAPAMKGLVVAEERPGSIMESKEELLAFARQTGNTVYHPACSCRMGPDPKTGDVVDSRLRVHGLRGVRIADASIMPIITSGNTHAPTVMIAEKAADMIKTGQAG